MPELGEPGHGEDGWTDLARYGWVGPTTVKRDGTDLARYGWEGPTTVKRDGLTWPGMAGVGPPR